MFEVARRHGLTLWAWSRGVWDTDRPDPSVLVRRATRLARPGMVLLLHDGRGEEPQPDVQSMLTALPAIIRELKQRGLRLRSGRRRVKVGILCENYFPTLGGEQEHIFNLRRHLESPRDGSAPVDVRIIVPHVAYDDLARSAGRRARDASGAFDPRSTAKARRRR